MKLKKIISLSLSLIMAVGSVNTAFAENDNVQIEWEIDNVIQENNVIENESEYEIVENSVESENEYVNNEINDLEENVKVDSDEIISVDDIDVEENTEIEAVEEDNIETEVIEEEKIEITDADAIKLEASAELEENVELTDNISSMEQEKDIPVQPMETYDTKYQVEGGYIYFDSSTGTITDADTSITSAIIPEKINGVSVISIGKYAFSSCESLTNITIPNSVTSIENDAFIWCSSLTHIIIPSSVSSISGPFYDCNNLKTAGPIGGGYNIEFGWSESIPNGAFYYSNNLTDVVIPDSIIKIGDDAFGMCCSLSTITIPSSVISIGNGVFWGCTDLTSINVSYDNKNYMSQNGILFNKDKTILICYPAGKTAIIYKIPSGIKEIESCAFEGCYRLTYISLPESVTSIGYFSFGWCNNLESILIPSSVTNIDIDAFNFSNPIIYCYEKSYAKEYAIAQNISYKITDNSPVTPPSFTVKGIFGGRQVTFNCDTSDAVIYYTTENRSALKLSDPHVNPGEAVTFNAYYGTIYARAYSKGKWSNVARLILKIPTVNTPTITKTGVNKVKIKTTTPSSIVYYTIDGTTPSATNYKGKFWCSHDVTIPSGKNVKAVAVRTCFSDSGVASNRT